MNDSQKNPFVKLRAMEPEDLDMLYMVENDVEHWCVGTTNVPYSRYVLHDYMAKASGDIYTDKQVRLIVDNERGEAVGIVDIVNFCPQHLRAELSVVIVKEERRKGYARAAVEKVMRYALDVLHLHQLYVIVNKDNVPSITLFKSLGFIEQSELADWLYDGKTFRNALVLQVFCKKCL